MTCMTCGRPLHEHRKERITHDDGRYSYNYVCEESPIWWWNA